MSAEVLLGAAYAALLLGGAVVLEWLSRHTHNRSQAYRTSGFDYDAQHDFWVCHQGEQLWPAEFDRERWGDDLESWAATRSAPEPESPNGSGPEDA